MEVSIKGISTTTRDEGKYVSHAADARGWMVKLAFVVLDYGERVPAPHAVAGSQAPELPVHWKSVVLTTIQQFQISTILPRGTNLD